MWPFRRRREQTLNEILLHEAGLDGEGDGTAAPASAPQQPAASVDRLAGTDAAETMAGGPNELTLPDDYHVLTVVHAPGISGDTARFDVLPSGDLIVDEEKGDADLSVFAQAIEHELSPPYRVLARRQKGDLWGLTAAAITVREIRFDDADELDLTCIGGVRTLRVDGAEDDRSVPELEQEGEQKAADYSVHAERLDGDLWEVRAGAL
jgi:hypothetical protein